MSPQDVSVVIPALNESENVVRAIESARQSGAGEIIVCDGGSSDGTMEAARRTGGTVITAPRGRGRQLRAGAAASTGALLLFLHADSWLSDACLPELVQRANSMERSRFGQEGQRFWGAFCQRIEADGRMYRALERGNAARVRWRGLPMGDQAMFVSRAFYDQVGGFADLPLMEDVDLSIRLRRSAWPELLVGPVHTSARRWEKRGIVRQTLQNWGIQLFHACGVSEQRLHQWYR